MLTTPISRGAGVPVFKDTNDRFPHIPCAVLVQHFPHFLRERIRTGRVFPFDEY